MWVIIGRYRYLDIFITLITLIILITFITLITTRLRFVDLVYINLSIFWSKLLLSDWNYVKCANITTYELVANHLEHLEEG